MEKYKRIMDEFQNAYKYAGKGIDAFLLENSLPIAENMLFLNISTGQATFNRKTFSFNVDTPHFFESLLQTYNPNYITILASSEPYQKKPILASPNFIKPKGDWGTSVWEVYRELYNEPRKSNANQAKLQLLLFSLFLSNNSQIKTAYFEGSVFNIFGWLYKDCTYSLTDIFLDVFFTFDEENICL